MLIVVCSALVFHSIATGPTFAAPTAGRVTQSPTAPAFIANPKSILDENPNGGGRLSTEIRDLLVSDGSTLGPIVDLIKDANDAQKMAISDGLAQAAKLLVLTNQALAADIQSRIAAINDPTITVAFTNALGDVRLGGVGAGAGPLGGAGVGSGGPSNLSGAASALENIGSQGTPTAAFAFTGGTTGGSGLPSQSITSVSPTLP